MARYSLLNPVGDEQVDSVLRGLIGVLESVFRDRIRSYYLTGSFADCTAVDTSDLDIVVVFKDHAGSQERSLVWEIGDHLSPLSGRFLDVSAESEESMLRDGHPLKHNSRFLHGQDIRGQMPEIPFTTYLDAALHSAAYFSVEVARHAQRLPLPLEFPDMYGEYYGYDYDPIEEKRDTKVLTAIVGHIATAIIALRAQERVTTKRESLLVYRRSINDEWTELVAAVFEICRNQWQYRIPDTADDRKRLQDICRAVLRFENHFFETYGQHTQVKAFLRTR